MRLTLYCISNRLVVIDQEIVVRRQSWELAFQSSSAMAHRILFGELEDIYSSALKLVLFKINECYLVCHSFDSESGHQVVILQNRYSLFVRAIIVICDGFKCIFDTQCFQRHECQGASLGGRHFA